MIWAGPSLVFYDTKNISNPEDPIELSKQALKIIRIYDDIYNFSTKRIEEPASFVRQ